LRARRAAGPGLRAPVVQLLVRQSTVEPFWYLSAQFTVFHLHGKRSVG